MAPFDLGLVEELVYDVPTAVVALAVPFLI